MVLPGKKVVEKMLNGGGLDEQVQAPKVGEE